MSATIPESMRLDDLLKATGYDCPVDLQGKTFDQATEGGSGGEGTTKLYVWKHIDEQTGNTFYLMTPTETLTENTKVFINNNESGYGYGTLLLIENSEEDIYYRFTENGIEFQTYGSGEYNLYTHSPSDDIDLF